MRKRFVKSALAVLIVGFVVGTVVGTAFASSSTWRGNVGGASVSASKSIDLWSYSWYTTLSSSADRAINVIGYTYWTIGEYCPSTYTWAYWHQFPGDYDTYKSWYYTHANVLYRGCNGTSRYHSYGNHDFGYNGSHVYPYVSTTESR